VRKELGFFARFLRAIAEFFAGIFHSLFGTTPNYTQRMEELGTRVAKEHASTLACLRVWTERMGLRDELRHRLHEAMVDAVSRAQADGGHPVTPARARELAALALKGFWAELGEQERVSSGEHVAKLADALGGVWPERVAAARAGAGQAMARDTDDVLLYLMTAEQKGLLRVPAAAEGFIAAMHAGLIGAEEVVRTVSGFADVPAADAEVMTAALAEVPDFGRVYAHALLAAANRDWTGSPAELALAVTQTRLLAGQVRALGTDAAVAEAYREGWLGLDPNAPLLSTLRMDETGRVLGNAEQEGILFIGMGDDSGFEAERLRRVAPEAILFVGNPTNKILKKNLGVPALLGEGKVRIRVKTPAGVELRDYNLNEPQEQRAFVAALGLTGARAKQLLEVFAVSNNTWSSYGQADARDELGLIAASFAEAERGARTIERVVLSSHSTGGSYWGSHNGTLYFDALARLAKLFPTAARQVEDFFIAACYNGGAASMRRFVEAFPSLKTLLAYQGSAPGSYTSATAHQLAWEVATRGPFTTGTALQEAREGLQSDLPPAQREGTRFYKSDHITIWTADTGFTPKGQAAEVLRREYAAGETTFREHYEGRHPIDSQQGPLRNYYNIVQSMLASEDVIGDERKALEARRDTTVRLLFYDSHVRHNFAETYGEIVSAGYAAAGRACPDFATLSRADALAEVEAFARAAGAGSNAETRRALELLRKGLIELSAELIPVGWL
jgi:hypothetical protein